MHTVIHSCTHILTVIRAVTRHYCALCSCFRHAFEAPPLQDITELAVINLLQQSLILQSFLGYDTKYCAFEAVF